MLLKNFSFQVIGYFSCCFALTGTLNLVKDSDADLYENFVDKYEMYRQKAGCTAPFCNRTDQQQQTTTSTTITCPPGWLCLPTISISKPEQKPEETSTCCSNCSCIGECEKEGTCCPDKLTSFPKHGKYHLGGIYGCLLTSVKERPELGQKYRRMISHCDVSYKDDYVVNLCEETNSDLLEQHIPVFQKQTKAVYKNKFCAWCNFIGDDELQLWKIHLKCKSNVVFIYKSLQTIVRELSQHDKCNIVFEKPSNFDDPPYCSSSISTCNVTGKWSKYDYFTEKACSSYSAPFTQSKVSYRNIFCFLCNTNERSPHFEICSRDKEMLEKSPMITISFAAILNFNIQPFPQLQKQEVDVPETCLQEDMVYDHHYNKCRAVTCPELTEWHNGTCKWLFPKAKGLCFQTTYRIAYKQPTNIIESEGSINNCCGSQGPTNSCCGRRDPTKICCDCENICEETQRQREEHFRNSLEFSFKVKDIAEKYFNQTFIDVEEFSIQTFPMIEYLEVHTIFSQDITFVDTLVNLDGQKIGSINGSDLTIEIFREQNLMTKTLNHRLDSSLELLKWKSCSKTYIVSKFLHCALLCLDGSEFEDSDQMGIILKHSNLTIPKKDFHRINGTHVYMCADDYLKSLPSRKVGIRKDPSSSTYKYISNLIILVCSVCSILCLIITIIVYTAFPSLRTQPGINNLSLSISLLFAFIFLLFGSLRSVQGISILCITVGMMSHFFWLNSMIWMNICCFHMFKSFGNMHATVHKNLTQKYLAYSLIPTLLFIIANIIYSEILSDGQNIGYGLTGNFCYILQPFMILCTMVIPTNTVLLSNLILYLIVICRICGTPMVRSSTVKDRSKFTIYIKLSTLTGIAWFVYIPVMITNNSIMRFIFDALVSLHGVFIMLAFVCNKRVMLLLRERLCWKVEQNIIASISIRSTTPCVQHSTV